MSRHHILMGQNIALDTTCADPTCCLAHGNLLLDDELRARDIRMIDAGKAEAIRLGMYPGEGFHPREYDALITEANEGADQ